MKGAAAGDTRSPRRGKSADAVGIAGAPADRLPARTCVGVTGLAYDALIEIDLVCRRM